MSNPVTNQQSGLEERVATLEHTLAVLIENLAVNNVRIIEMFRVLVEEDNSRSKKAALKECEGGICTTNPPGCKNKDKDKDKDKN